MTVHNYYYYNPKKIDLGKLRAEAAGTATGTLHWMTPPATAIIHHHDSEDSCKGKQHERFPVVEDDVEVDPEEVPILRFVAEEDLVKG